MSSSQTVKSIFHLKNHPWLFQKVCPHVSTNDLVFFVKADLSVLPESTTVVISGCFCISNGLQTHQILQNISHICMMIQWSDPAGRNDLLYLSDWVGRQNFVFHPSFAARFANHSKVPHSIASRYSFSSSRLTAHNDGLILVIPTVYTKNAALKYQPGLVLILACQTCTHPVFLSSFK